ncbi:MAG TPA: hypothetical protein VGG20_08765 [Thermoanaerobaculia bacterium]|jgi:hypothetical protein
MVQLNARRAAASVLVLALSLLTVSAAGATPRVRPHTHPTAPGIAGWIRSAVIDVLWKSGIRIDPNGGH